MNMEQTEILVNVEHAGIQGFETFVDGLILSLIGLFTLLLIILPIKILSVILAIIILFLSINQNSADSTSVNTTIISYILIIIVGLPFSSNLLIISNYYNLNVSEWLSLFRNDITECFNLCIQNEYHWIFQLILKYRFSQLKFDFLGLAEESESRILNQVLRLVDQPQIYGTSGLSQCSNYRSWKDITFWLNPHII